MSKRQIFKKIYRRVKQIPQGKVATYGMIAREVGTTPRVVGFALHANQDRRLPCHRVVNREGRLAPGYVFGGLTSQKQRLMAEGVRFKKGKVDLKRCLVSATFEEEILVDPWRRLREALT